MTRYGYYPGCSLLSGAKEYDLSLRAVAAHLGLELVEIEDWNCCGAIHADVNQAEASLLLPARNLALAEQQGLSEILAPCSGCYKNLRRASKAVAAGREARERVNAGLAEGLALNGHVEVLHPLYVFLQTDMLAALRKRVVRPLGALRVASYYGCMLTRPRDVFDSPEWPQGLDTLLTALGAQCVDYPLKAKCCGGALALSHSEVTARLSGKVLDAARGAGADAVALACPMCHTALDSYQGKAARAVGHPLDLPVLYFTQWMGLALGLEPDRLGLGRHLVETGRVVAAVMGVGAA